MTSNMVLRYRDLIAETIEEHRKHIKQYGYVWWGWWNKPNEKIPSIELAHFMDIVRSNGHLWIFLANSGTFGLQKAKLTDICITDDGGAKHCAEIEKVPEYYSAAKYKVWFRLDDIEDTIPDELCNWAYSKPEDFLYTNDFEYFDNKRIGSMKEMLTQRHMTIYFIDKYDKNLSCNGSDKQDTASYNSNYEYHATKLDALVNDIMVLVESINKQCAFASSRVLSPIQMPKYPKEIEDGLRTPANDENSLKQFTNYLYMLIVDGHKYVLYDDRAIIRKSFFYSFENNLIYDIRLARNHYHHLGSDSHQNKLNKLGELFFKTCGKRLIDDETSINTFQISLLTRTEELLKNELNAVKGEIQKFEDHR